MTTWMPPRGSATGHVTLDDDLTLAVSEVTLFGSGGVEWTADVEGDHWQERLYPLQGRQITLRHGDGGFIGPFTSFDLWPVGGGCWRIRGAIGHVPSEAMRLAAGTARAARTCGITAADLAMVFARPFGGIPAPGPDPAADARAESLLIAHLDESQRAEYEAGGAFTVAGESGRRYRVRKGRSFNVDELDREGRPKQRLCVVPAASVPMADQMLAQKLLIEADEKRFRKTANRAPADRRPGWL